MDKKNYLKMFGLVNALFESTIQSILQTVDLTLPCVLVLKFQGNRWINYNKILDQKR